MFEVSVREVIRSGVSHPCAFGPQESVFLAGVAEEEHRSGCDRAVFGRVSEPFGAVIDEFWEEVSRGNFVEDLGAVFFEPLQRGRFVVAHVLGGVGNVASPSATHRGSL